MGLLISKQYDPNDERHIALSKRLSGSLSLYLDDRNFRYAPGSKETEDQFRPLLLALDKVRTALEGLDPIVFRKVNRQLYEGDIPILDAVVGHAGGGRTDAPQDIADVLYDLAGTLTTHISNIPKAKSKPGKKTDRRNLFLAQELAYIYKRATGKDAAGTDFLGFIERVIEDAGIEIGAEHISKLAQETVTSPIPIVEG